MRPLLYLLLLATFAFPKNTFAQNGHNVWITTAHQDYIYNSVAGETTPHLYGTLHDPDNETDSWFEASISVYDEEWNHLYDRTEVNLGGDTLNLRWNLGNEVIAGEDYNLVFNLVQWTSDWSSPPLWNTTDTAVIVVDYPLLTEIEEEPVAEEPELLAYPNPTFGPVTVSGLSKDVDEQIFVYDTQGRLVLQSPAYGKQTLQLDLSSLKNGMYLIKLPSGKHSYITKS
jgi:hypothetical protein